MPLSAGTRLGPYEILAPLGKGGMGEVYRSRDTRLHRDVAIKVVQPGKADPSLWTRFEREARAASALSHPNICAIFDTGEADGQPYLVMELLEGETLQHRIGTTPMTADAAVAVAVQIADALEAAHAKGILHRDIKPANVMILARGHVKVLDFGLAKQTSIRESSETLTLHTETRTGAILGTPAYMAPEVLQGEKADVRTDLWALGAVLYQMLTGELPFQGATTFAVSSAILKEQPPPLPASVPPMLAAIVGRCLEKLPENRYQTAGELRVALEQSQAGARAAAPAPVRTTPRLWLWVAAAVVLAAIAGFLIWQQHPRVSARTLSTGGPVSHNQEANELFELAQNFQTIQNDIPKGQQTVKRALDLDPHFAEALRYHAFDYVILLLNGYTNDTSTLYLAEAELRQAAQEDPGLLSLPSTQAALYMSQGRKDLVPLARLEQQGRDHPMQAEATVWRIIFRMMSEEDSSAKDLADKVLSANPLAGSVRMFRGELLRTEGDSAGAIREERKVLEQAPDNISAIVLLVKAYLDHGDVEQARTLLESKRPIFAQNYSWRQSWAFLLAAEHKDDEALKAMDEETLKFAAAAFTSTAVTADFYAILGDKLKAIQWLEQAVRNGDERVGYFERDPWLKNIQQEPAFRRIVDSVEARRAKQPRP